MLDTHKLLSVAINSDILDRLACDLRLYGYYSLRTINCSAGESSSFISCLRSKKLINTGLIIIGQCVRFIVLIIRCLVSAKY